MTNLIPFDKFILDYCSTPGKMLDVGVSGQIVSSYIESLGHIYESLNLGFGTYDVTETPYQWTMISDNTFDYVISLCAFEHIEFPWLTFLEMVRVTKNNGIIYVLAPSTGHYHPNVLDCWRYFPDGMKALAKWGNVSVINVDICSTDIWEYCQGIFRKENK